MRDEPRNQPHLLSATYRTFQSRAFPKATLVRALSAGRKSLVYTCILSFTYVKK